jgi:hypothetical protein
MDWLVLAAVLFLQPLLWVLFVVLGVRYVFKKNLRSLGNWADTRIEKASEELKP